MVPRSWVGQHDAVNAPLPRSVIDDGVFERSAAQVRLSTPYLLYMACSGVLASVALTSSSVPILIGSMIVAPLMPPLALTVFALCARQRTEAARGLGIALAGLGLAFVTAWSTTGLMEGLGVIGPDVVLLNKPLLEERVHPGWWSLAAAVAAGVAGILAQAHEKTDTLIGTVAALALVPAVGAVAIAIFVGAWTTALGGLLLLVMNVGVIVAMGVTVVLLSSGRAGLRPLALLPIVIVVVVALLLVLAQSSDTVPETPSNTGLGEAAAPQGPHDEWPF